MNYRDKRLSGLIQHELSKLVVKTMEFEGALVTITDVTVDGTLDNAVALVAVLPEQKASQVLEALNVNRATLQFQLVRILQIRPMPNLVFKYDSGAVNAAAVEKALGGK